MVTKEEGLSSEPCESLESHYHPYRQQQEAGDLRKYVHSGPEGLEKKKMPDYPERVDCVENCTESCFIAVGGGGKT